MTLNAVRAHVFNKMPICLPAFDKSGSNIQLIGRNKISTHILSGVLAKTAEPKFQSAWAAAESLTDVDNVITSMRYRHNRMKELLRKVIEKSVNYAILSHTWMRDTPGDVTFQDWAMREHNPQGNMKIVKFCEVTAQNHNITLGWKDTVCINKDSSSELDESIRSMYNWYRGASVCITYLSGSANIYNAHHDSWFTRGWTLQERMMPRRECVAGESSNVTDEQTRCGRTKGPDGIQPISVLRAVQLDALLMPFAPLAVISQLFLGRPADIFNDLRDRLRATVSNKID